MKKTLLSLVACLGLAVSAFAADITGKWVANVERPNGGGTVQQTINLKADGDKLTGTVTSPRGEVEISDGKVDGDKITFNTTMNFQGNSMKILYEGVVNGDTVEFTRFREGGERKQQFTAKRQ